MTDAAGVFGKPFRFQVAALRLRFAQLQPTAKWTDVWQAGHDRAFMVAGAMKADLLADLATAVDKAVSQGTTLEEFRKDFRQIVEKSGWHGWTGEGTKKGEAWRTKVIYQTNLSTSYAAGRFAQLTEAGFKFWVYFHGNAREPRLQHLAWDGLILPPEHPFWASHYPPNGWGCTCYVGGARSEAGAVRLGGKPGVTLPDDWQAPDPRTGAPKGIGKGWAYAPGASVSQTVAIGTKKISELPALLGSDLGTGMAGIIDRAWPMWVADTQVGGRHDPGLAGVLSRQLIDALTAAGRPPVSADILVNPGLLSGPKANRHQRRDDSLTSEQWLLLPSLLRRPRAVMLDNRSGKLILILDGSDRLPQLAVELDQLVAPRRGAREVPANLIVSAYRANLSDLVGRVAGNLLSVLFGGLG